ncbi:flavin monoamine oxidase family protein [Methylocapsa sp. S129]|uniref:flavin monoamine oxidase family protein n=1 Tax=Methylocapsa sp. S129 TaxID=1641869 RepID=UPI00131E52F3|nr:flavin monoamine oxidase family protein [Methylocapsa sp. S129]
MSDAASPPLTRRNLLTLIGASAGGTAMYQAMTSLGFAAESPYRGPIKLEGDPKGASVVILGAGLAGMTAAFELGRAGYKVRILEYNNRAGGRNWSLRGGDAYTELGGATQHCTFDDGLYLNPGPWRIPYHHYALLDYCRRFGVTLEPFIQLNHNAFLHSSKAFGGRPQRIREIKADFEGAIAELLAKATRQGALDDAVSKDDQAILIEALRAHGGLDKDFRYVASDESAEFRGYAKDPGGGLGAAPVNGEPIGMHDILTSRLWQGLQNFLSYDFQTTMFQPVGGMGRIGEAFARQLPNAIRYGAKVTGIRQDERGVTVAFEDLARDGTIEEARADWCVCALPLTILSQLPVEVSAPMKAAIDAVPYSSSVKFGLQFRRRFWEEDEHIFGGISYTDLPIRHISYPSAGYNSGGKGVLLGGYIWNGPNAYEFTAMSPAERIARALDDGAQIHPQYRSEFETGISVAWHRAPFTLGCAGEWTEETRRDHYDNLCQIDGRIVLAGEHASYIPAWQEGAILSALDAIARLHKRVVAA